MIIPLVVIGLLLIAMIGLYRLSPPTRSCDDCEALSLSESGSMPPTPHQIEHTHVQAA